MIELDERAKLAARYTGMIADTYIPTFRLNLGMYSLYNVYKGKSVDLHDERLIDDLINNFKIVLDIQSPEEPAARLFRFLVGEKEINDTSAIPSDLGLKVCKAFGTENFLTEAFATGRIPGSLLVILFACIARECAIHTPSSNGNDDLMERCYSSILPSTWPQDLWFDLHQEFEEFLIDTHESLEIIMPVRMLKYGSWIGMKKYVPCRAPEEFDTPEHVVSPSTDYKPSLFLFYTNMPTSEGMLSLLENVLQDELKEYVEARWEDPEYYIGDLYATPSRLPLPGRGAKMVGIDMTNPYAILQAINQHQKDLRAR